ncbi:hypothetical protein TKK_0019459 [Trichogramma kaykai]|uniref:Lipocalin/cytosolic fatty-acid binding domain-containing protein n=1 Tax=Trichogramma kaykai TaxID=54128 RepID=A0ABD2VSU6_9HYME
MWILLPLLGSLLVSGTIAQVPFLGGCPKVDLKHDFDVQQYLGKWYEAERYFALFEVGGKCVTATYTLNPNGTVSVENRQINTLTGNPSSIVGHATLKNDNRAQLSVVFPSLPVSFDAPYWILDTDYTSYAVVWSCNDFRVFSTRNAWILTREQHPPVAVLEKAYHALDKNKISKAFFMRTDQKNCIEKGSSENHVS